MKPRDQRLRMHSYMQSARTAQSFSEHPVLIFDHSLRNSLNRLEEFIRSLNRHLEMDERMFTNMLVVLSEAVTNSIVHGNKFSDRKKVKLGFTAVPGLITFSVEDEGEGFNCSSSNDPLAEETFYNAGRGILIMKYLSDSFYYSNGGKKLNIGFLY